MKSDLCESHQVFQRYHPNFLSSSQRKTAVQPDPQITDKCLLCSLLVGGLGQRKKCILVLSKRNLPLVPRFCLETSRTWPIHKNVLEILNARLRERCSHGVDTRRTEVFWGRRTKNNFPQEESGQCKG